MNSIVTMPSAAANSAQSSEQTNGGKFTPGNPYRFRKGVSGNPKGRPRTPVLSDELLRLLESAVPDNAEGRRIRKRFGLPTNTRWVTVLAHAMVRMALRSSEAAKQIGDRVEGTPTQKVEISSPLDVRIRVTYEQGELKA